MSILNYKLSSGDNFKFDLNHIICTYKYLSLEALTVKASLKSILKTS